MWEISYPQEPIWGSMESRLEFSQNERKNQVMQSLVGVKIWGLFAKDQKKKNRVTLSGRCFQNILLAAGIVIWSISVASEL